MDNLTEQELNNVTGGTKIPYLIKQGDTLDALATKFHCTVDDICKWNGIKDPNIIFVGQRLIFKF